MPRRYGTAATTTVNEWADAFDQTIWSAWSSNQTWTNSASTVLYTRATNVTASTLDKVIWVSWSNAAPSAITEDYIRAVATQEAQTRESAVRMAGERAKARQKAETLLQECLSPKQREELALHQYFHIETIGSNGERRRYRIERGRVRNVKQVTPEGLVIKTLCMHPVDHIPDADTMLAQKLYLEGSEQEFLSIANHS